MIIKIADYTVKPEHRQQAEKVVAVFVKTVNREEPETIYEAFALAGTNRFVHLMKFPTPEAEVRHRSAMHTKQFTDVLYPMCEQEPVFFDCTEMR